MQIAPLISFDALRSQADRWNELAGDIPFRRWEWLESWWKHYGQANLPFRGQSRLLLLTAWEGGRLVGVAPWYTQPLLGGRCAIRALGMGDVCSEYSTILSESEYREPVIDSMVDWLIQRDRQRTPDESAWDLLELDGVCASDESINLLATQLDFAGYSIHRQPGMCCWRVPLSTDWEEFLASLSKSHRKKVRRLEHRFADSVRVRRYHSCDLAELNAAFDILVDLHQRRWNSRGEPGCFASDRFLSFHYDVLQHFIPQGRAVLSWIELDGTPLAIEYQLIGGDTVYAYQSGIDPDRLDTEPGRMVLIEAIQSCIAAGYRKYDFLRGDEPYKAHWRAEPHPMIKLQIVPPSRMAQTRYGVNAVTGKIRGWIKSGLELAHLR